MEIKKDQKILVKTNQQNWKRLGEKEWVEGRFVAEIPGSHENYKYAVLIKNRFNEVESINVAEEDIVPIDKKLGYKEGQKLLVQTGIGHWEVGKFMWENTSAPSKYRYAVRIDYAHDVCRSINVGDYDIKPLKKESR